MRYSNIINCITISIFVLHRATASYDAAILQSPPWPVPVDSFVEFRINREFDTTSEILIEIINAKTSRKFVKIFPKHFVDLSTDYFIIDKNITKVGTKQFTLQIKFLEKSHGHQLVFHWFQTGPNNIDEESLRSSSYAIIKEKVSLTKKWQMKLQLQVVEYDSNNQPVYYEDEMYFQVGKRVKATCVAHGGLPSAEVYFASTQRPISDTVYDTKQNTIVGYFYLRVVDHNSNFTCIVKGTKQQQTSQIRVIHPTTSVSLSPDYTGFVRNGSTVKCYPLDGYPEPSIKWDYLSVRNHSNPRSLFLIKNDELTFLHNAPPGVQLEFNCTTFYTNSLTRELMVYQRTFKFEIGDQPNNIEEYMSSFSPVNITSTDSYAKLNKAAIGAAVAGVVIIIIAVSIVIMLCRSKPKSGQSLSYREEGSPKYEGSLLAGNKSNLRNQMKSHNGAGSTLLANDTVPNSEPNEYNYDDMPRGRKPIKVVDDSVVYSTIVGTMQPKTRPSLDFGPIDRV